MVLHFKNKLRGERLILDINQPTLEFALEMFTRVDENREYLSKWLPWAPLTITVEDTIKYLFEVEEKTKLGKMLNYGIFLAGDYIGNIGIFDIDEDNQSAEIGYWLSESFAKKGYMVEAVKILEKELFEKQGFNRLQIKCDELNKPSIKVALNCGYKLEGLLRENCYIEPEDRFRNTCVYSKLKSEYIYNKNLINLQ